ncbi:MAG: hypothetical protein LLF97_10330, partial [Planctomycetaceae bacterium]|nr:hypothetical protein [Planctomycetaceae bacterium]
MNRHTTFAAHWLGFRCLLAVALVAAACSQGFADPTAPSASDRQITLSVTSLLKQHLSRHPLDKEISERCLKNFLKALDPMKVYFYQSDVDEFMKHEDELSDAALHGDVTFAYTVFRVFLQRVDERVKMVDELLAAKHDFTVDEQMSVDRDAAQYPRDRAEAFDRWRKRVKYDLLVLKVNDKEEAADKEKNKDKDKNDSAKNGAAAKPKTEQEQMQEARQKLVRRYRSFAKRMHQIDNEELLEMYLNALTTSFDPHTDYMSSDTQ